MDNNEFNEKVKPIRTKIDEIDKQIVNLVCSRAALAKQIGKIKENTDMPYYEPLRETEVLNNICKLRTDDISDEALIRIFQALIQEMRELQKQ